MTNVQWFCAGWAFGAALVWFHFWANDLIRTRDEYYKAHPEKRPRKKGPQ